MDMFKSQSENQNQKGEIFQDSFIDDPINIFYLKL